MKNDLSVAQLRDELSYVPETGAFTWLKPGRGRRLTKSAGGMDRQGYLSIHLGQASHSAHRLAWLYVHGHWPAGQVDHINGMKADNRIVNLRDVPQSVNMQNQRRPQSHNTSGYLGVSYDRFCDRFAARIWVNGRNRLIGRFKDPESAYKAYLATKRQLHEGCTI